MSDISKGDYENLVAFAKALFVETLPPPCIDCPFFKTCAEQSLACKDFYVYVRNASSKHGPKYTLNPRLRNPNFNWYRQIFLTPRTQPEN